MYFLIAGFSADLLLMIEKNIKHSHYLSHIIDLRQINTSRTAVADTLDIAIWQSDICSDFMQSLYEQVNKKSVLNFLRSNIQIIQQYIPPKRCRLNIKKHTIYNNSPHTCMLLPVCAASTLSDFSIDLLSPEYLQHYENVLLSSIQDILQEYDISAHIQNHIWYFNAPWLVPLKTYHPYQAIQSGAKSCLLQTWPCTYYQSSNVYTMAQATLLKLKKLLNDIQITWHNQNNIALSTLAKPQANMLWPMSFMPNTLNILAHYDDNTLLTLNLNNIHIWNELYKSVKSLENYCIINNAFLHVEDTNINKYMNIPINATNTNTYSIFDEKNNEVRIFKTKTKTKNK